MPAGAPITAARALELGIVNEVVPADALDNRVQDIARQLARSAPLALRGLLDAVHVGGECSLDAGLEFESAQFGLLFATEDMREGTSAFPAAPPAGVPEPLTPWLPDPIPRSCSPGSRQTILTAPCRPG